MAKKDRPHGLFERFKRYIQAKKLIAPGSTVLAAVSGGIDSAVLLDLMWELSHEWGLDLAVLHVNHQLRGREADADEKFVGSLAKGYRVQAFIGRVETKKEAARKKISIQEAARDLRYAFFLTKKAELDADAVVTAHNADDNAETMLLNFLRGTGIDGLAGIPASRSQGSIVRPLLFASRKEIAEYARGRKLKFREDSSNLTDKYSRNFLRRKVIPKIEERINPSLTASLMSSAAVFRMNAGYLHDQVRNAWKGAVSEKDGEMFFLKVEMLKQHPFLRQMIVHDVFLKTGIEPSADRIGAVVSLLDNEPGTRVDCGNGWKAENESGRIRLSQMNLAGGFSFVLNDEGTVENGFFSLSVKKSRNLPNKLGRNSSTEYVDAGKVRFPLCVRSWKEGDSFVPLGMKQKKKVSDLFVDLKIPRTEKRRIPVVESEGNIVWVAGCRIDDRFKITSTSTEAYKLSIRTA
ncbi:MAG TPA: tRNA lysidine(34) synthetase TilS [Bacteroidota bacterium]|nr:tRNA lysidine(34) synthetase TilS [Bacteroidota bacterium]